MKLEVLEFNKSSTQTIDEFSDLIQKIINENDELRDFRCYESSYSGSIKVELLFSGVKSKLVEVLAFGPAPQCDIMSQLNGTMEVACNQSKDTKFAGLVPLSKSPRCVGFLVLQKDIENKGITESAKIQ